MTIPFHREPENGLLLVAVEIDRKYALNMALDTGATHTTVDSNTLHLLGYDLSESIGKVEIETANGVVSSDLFEVTSIEAFGIRRERFQVQAYDFISHGIFTEYDGLLGLDFFEDKKLCIDFKSNMISID